jgi:4-hydroxy-3-methylbut-2-enyl diphosphate reductase
MRVLRASSLGMCFGVRDALQLMEGVPDPRAVTIHGELVHNEEIQTQLARRGFHLTPEHDRGELPATPLVVITAHGVSEKERRRLREAGKELLDTTCPLVRRVHDAAQNLQRLGYFIVVIGRRGHVEVEGIVGDLDRYAVVQNAGEARRFEADRLGVVCQSTTPPAEALEVLAALEAANRGKEIRYVDTICRPTRERQQAVLALLGRVEALVVVGGKHSNNTRQLARLAESRGVPVLQVQTAEDLDPAWLASFEVVGLTAGTSTPDPVIESVYQALTRPEFGRRPGAIGS